MMLRRISSDGARAALRMRAADGRSAPLIQPAFQSFHAGVPSRQTFEEMRAERMAMLEGMTTKQKVEWYAQQPLFDLPRFNAFIEKTGFNQPKRLVPLGLMIGTPIIMNNLFHFDDETLLLACFLMFLGCTIDVAGDTVAKVLDDGAAKILKEFNEAEEVEIKELTAELEMNKAKVDAKEDIQVIYEARCHADELQAEMLTLEARHKHREKTVKMLDAFKAGRMKRIIEMRTAEVEKALQEVVKKVESDKKLKKSALDNALMALGDPGAAAKVDPVSQMFTQYWKDNAAHMEKIKNQPIKMTPEERERSEADIRAIFAKFGDDPTDFIKSLPDSYKPSDANLLC